MTPKSLFNIILKILGLFFLNEIIVGLAQLVSVIFLLNVPGIEFNDIIWELLGTIFALIVYFIFPYYLIFKSDWIIEKLKLDKGFDQETIPLNIHRSTILSIAIIVIGGLLIVNEIPNLCNLLYDYFNARKMEMGFERPNPSYIVIAISKLIIGIILIIYQRPIVNFIERQRKK